VSLGRNGIRELRTCGADVSRTRSEISHRQVLDATHSYIPVQLSAVPVKDGGSVVAIFGLDQTLPHSPPPPAKRSPSPVLTTRQLQVLQLLAGGSSTDEIARCLRLSPTTVRNHVASLLSALAAHSRLQAVVKATQTGLLDP